MPIYEEMNDRDQTRAAALMDKTERLDVVRHADKPASDDGPLAGRYESREVLGRGATGVVYRGLDRVLRRDVAIKLLYADLAQEDETSERFQREAQLAARIHHPNAVAIFDTGVHEGQPFIVMECLPGETLAALIAAQPLPVEAVREIGAQLLDALDAAHQRGVIHRDIKPTNLLLTSTGSVKVADFGIATAGDRNNLTSVGFVVGTLAYLAPERLRGAPATPQSDIYSAGVVLYEALTGRKPFAGDTPAGLMGEISNGSPIHIKSLRPDLDPALAGVVMRAIAAEPAARYATAAAMAQALDESRTTSARSSLPPPPAPAAMVMPLAEAGPSRRRGRSLTILAAALVALLSLGAFASRGGLSVNSPTSTAPAGSEGTGGSQIVVPVVSTTIVTTTVRPTTTRPAVTTTTENERGKDKKKEDDDD